MSGFDNELDEWLTYNFDDVFSDDFGDDDTTFTVLTEPDVTSAKIRLVIVKTIGSRQWLWLSW